MSTKVWIDKKGSSLRLRYTFNGRQQISLGVSDNSIGRSYAELMAAGKARSKMNAVKVLTPRQLESNSTMADLKRLCREGKEKWKELERLAKELRV